MDNFTHSLAGWTLGQTGLKTKTRKGLAALILGANAPDVDVFFWWVPWAPLATHRGITHSLLVGLPLLPLGLAGLLWLFDRWQVKRGATFKSGLEMHFGWLLALSYIGCLTHPLLDWQTNYAIQLFSPFSTRWYHADSLFILDVWIWSGLAFAVWLSRRREKRGQGDWRRPATVGFAALVLYISANGAESGIAREAPVTGPPHAKPDTVVVGPPPVLFWKRNVLWRQDHAIGQGDYDPFVSLTELQDYAEPTPDEMTDPLARAGLKQPEMIRFARWSILPMAWITRQRCSTLVRYQDARFGMRPGSGRLGESVRLPTGAPDCGA